MRRLLLLAALGSWSACTARPAFAADTCTISYRIDATLQISDTYLGKGNETVRSIPGSLVLRYEQKDGRVVDGKVKILHFAMYESFTIDAMIDVTTTVHHFSPSCNGIESPAWRRPGDAGFPAECRYMGNTRAVAVGTLDRKAGTIEWAKCKAAPSYWSKDRRAYTPSQKSRGRGCLDPMHAVGNVHCDGKIACKWGGLKPGDNPERSVWAQPLIHGPPESDETVAVSANLSTITTPRYRKDGYQSYNLPNDSPSRTWFSWTATRDDSSPFTTCP
ncbi:MAG: hypothetical protein AMJ62_05770 [Myxococcales bacterium SG8_38]|nr:MAG: hypothetical protein AMJ62_05770 [Myxococcales bacterium SG8_38]